MSPPSGSPALAQWHAVTPHTRPLSISILELAPTSVTLALTRAPPQHTLTPAQHIVHSAAHHHHCGKKKKHQKHQRKAESDENDDDDDSGSGSHVPGAYPSLLVEGQTFKDMLSHGVVVTLDGMPWSRIVAHVSDDAEEEEQDEEEEWEDEEEAHEEETVGTTSGTAPHAARRRKGRRPSSGPARRPKTHDKPAGAHRWDRERAVVVVYDLDPSKEHEIELQIVGLAGEVKESLGKLALTLAAADSSPHLQHRPHPPSIAEQLEPAPQIAGQLAPFALQTTITVQLGEHAGSARSLTTSEH